MSSSDQRREVARGIADALVAADNNKGTAKARLKQALGRDWGWFDSLMPTLHRTFGAVGGNALAPLYEPLAEVILRHRGFMRAWDDAPNPPPRVVARFVAPRAMQKPVFALADCAVPDLPTVFDLARWLDLTVAELDWFAAHGGYAHASSEALRHYRYQWVPKRSGSLRLLEIPKSRLKEIQRRILKGILDFVPPHEAAHGFRARHSCLTHARLHSGQAAVLRMDLRNFFASIPAARINGVFGALGFPRSVAWVLTGLCTHAPARSQLIAAAAGLNSGAPLEWRVLKSFTAPHLPQGAPSSPVLANLCAFKLDLRLAALAADAGAVYSRYADDLAFSGGDVFARGAERLKTAITGVVAAEGFGINPSKTRLMRSAQRQALTGLVVNRHPNIRRQDYDLLKAVLHQCAVSGPALQNRHGVPAFKEHLRGRVAHVAQVHPAHGAKLQAMLGRIDWSGYRET